MIQSISWKMKAVNAMVLAALLSACGSGGSGSNGSERLDIGLHNGSGSQNSGGSALGGNNSINGNHSSNGTISSNNGNANHPNNSVTSGENSSNSYSNHNQNNQSSNNSTPIVAPLLPIHAVNNVKSFANVQAATSDNWTFKQLSDADLKTATGEGVYVAVVDTGIERNGVGLINRNQNISKKSMSINDGKLETTHDTLRTGGHGTAVTEVLLDTAPDAAVNSMVNSPAGQGTFSIAGLKNLLAALDTGAKADIVNNSSGLPVGSDDAVTEYGKDYKTLKEQPLLPYYRALVKRGVLVLKATGNDGRAIPNVGSALPLVAPELADGFLAVSAYDQQFYHRKSENACGELTKAWCITAPEMFQIYGERTNQKAWVAGTSLATPYVAGLAAKIKSRYDWFTNTDLKNTLITTADDMGDPGVDAVWGNGLVNADRAVKGYGRFDKDVTLNVDGIKRAYFFDNDISGSGGVIKKGKDALVVSGNNTYTGNTTIAEGEWVANGNSQSRHIVQKGATLTIGDQNPTIELKSVSNQGTLSVNLSNLKINGDLDNTNGAVEQAIGTKIDVSGSANLTNASWVLTGIKKDYVTKAGQTEILLNAKNISGKDGFQFFVANANLGELINQKYDLNDTQLSVTTARKSVGDVVRDKTNFVGKDKTVVALDGLLDKLDEIKLAEAYQKDYLAEGHVQNNTHSLSATLAAPGYAVAGALLSSSNVNKTIFEMNTQTAQHAQESTINQKIMRTDDLLTHTLQASDKGNVWTSIGYGKTTSNLANINGESKDNSQTIGATYRLEQHRLGMQLSHLSHQWSEEFSGSLKKINTDGAGIEAAYTFQHSNYWLSALAGMDFLKAKTSFGSDHANQYLFGLNAGKNFPLLGGRLNLMPSVGLKYAQINGLDYRLQQYNSEYVSANNVKTRETSLSTGLDSAYRLGEKGNWLLMAGLKLRQILDGKTTYTADYGGYLVNMSDTHRRGKRPDWMANIGIDYRVSDTVNVYLSGAYENGKYHNKRTINAGLNMSF